MHLKKLDFFKQKLNAVLHDYNFNNLENYTIDSNCGSDIAIINPYQSLKDSGKAYE